MPIAALTQALALRNGRLHALALASPAAIADDNERRCRGYFGWRRAVRQRDGYFGVDQVVGALVALPGRPDQHRGTSSARQPLALVLDRGLARRDPLVQQGRGFGRWAVITAASGISFVRNASTASAARRRSPGLRPSRDRARHALATTA